MEVKYYIYQIKNNINSKVYVGQTTETLSQRFKRHIGYQLNATYQSKIHKAMIKYGKENFYIELIEEVKNQEILTKREYYWIHKLNSINNGYNINDSGLKYGGDTLSNHPNKKIIFQKISKSVTGGKNHKSRTVKAIDLLNSKEYIYLSLAECVKDLELVTHKNITRITNDGKKTPYRKRWWFEYID